MEFMAGYQVTVTVPDILWVRDFIIDKTGA